MGLLLSQLLDNYSYLQLYWLLQAGHATVTLAYRSITGRSSIDAVGSSSPTEHQTLGWLEFKRHPVQAYILGALWSTYVLFTTASAYFFGSEPSSRFQWMFGFATDPRNISTDTLSTILGLSLLTIHSSRRLYQSMYVSIFSRHRTAGLLSLLNGWLFHIAAGLSVVAESPSFTKQDFDLSNIVSSLRWYHIPAVALFIGASKVQSDTLQQLAKMRRNKAGHIVTTGYKLPRGGWFDRLNVSSPQFLAEILVHVAIGVSLGPPTARLSAFTWWLLTGYVIVNHVQLALDKQLLYRAKFEDLPKDRKMLVPHVL